MYSLNYSAFYLHMIFQQNKTKSYWFSLTNLCLAPVLPALLESHRTSWWCPHGESNHNRIWCQLPHATSQRRSVNLIQVLETRGQLEKRFSICYPDCTLLRFPQCLSVAFQQFSQKRSLGGSLCADPNFGMLARPCCLRYSTVCDSLY